VIESQPVAPVKGSLVLTELVAAGKATDAEQ
jgi:hypothetical protein